MLLDVAFADVSADQLTFAVDGVVPPMLAAVTIDAVQPGAAALTLGILGSSHVAFVGDRAAPLFVEELSCDAVGGVSIADVLGSAQLWSHSTALSRCDIEVVRCAGKVGADAEFAGIVDDIRAHGRAEGCIVAEFPGVVDAVTVVRGWADESGFQWQTWHVYPRGGAGGGDVVCTHSRWVAPSVSSMGEGQR